LWVNSKQVLNLTGISTCFDNPYGPRFKAGAYKGANYKYPGSPFNVYIDEYRHGDQNSSYDVIDAAFSAHRQWRETQDDTAYHDWAERLKLEVKAALEQWLSKAGYAAGLLLRSLRDKAHQWWYFLDHPEVPPDNNRSERFLRLAVTKRKVCGGSRSMEGFGQTAVLLTVIQTCRTQSRSAFEFFIRALRAFSASDTQPIPSLIPESNT
jgi:Transposase IS66 family